MPKRKVGGYAISDSSDADSEPEQPPPKKKAFAPPLLTKSAFKRPNDSASSRLQPSSSRPGLSLAYSALSTAPGQKATAPAATHTSFPTPRETPSTKIRQSDRFGPTVSIESSDDDGAPTSPMIDVRAKGKGRAQDVEVGSSRSHPAPPPGISRLVVERQLNEMSEKVDDYALKGDGHAKDVGKLRKEVGKLAEDVRDFTQQMKDYMLAMDNWKAQFLLDAASAPRVAPTDGITTTCASGTPESVMSPSTTFNPRTDFDSAVPISDVTVIAAAIACYKSRKNDEMPVIPEDNLIKKLLRSCAYESLDNVHGRTDVKPFFFGRDGLPELQPAFLCDPITGLCSYYPHWDKLLDGQAAWVHHVLKLLRAKAPRNGTDLSITARTISEDILVELFIKGPWETLKGGWRTLKKSESEIDQMRQALRQAKRPGAKARSRTAWRPEVPALGGEECDAIFHEGMQSGEESDPQNPDFMEVLIPESRSSSLNALYRAGDEYNRKQREALPGHTFQRRGRRIKVVPVDTIPELKRGNQILKIPLWTFARKWRKDNKQLLKTYAHRIDMSLKDPPAITEFLEKHQRQESEDNGDEEADALRMAPQQPQFDIEDNVEGSDGNEDGNGDEVAPDIRMGGDDEFGEVVDELDEDDQEDLETDPQVDTTVPYVDPKVIDPELMRETSSAAAAKPKPRPRPIPLEETPATTVGVPAPSSEIQIKNPPFNFVVIPLPEPHPNHSNPQPMSSTNPQPPAHPAMAPAEVPFVPFALPPGTPHSPPPMLPPPLPTLPVINPPTKKPKKKVKNTAKTQEGEGVVKEKNAAGKGKAGTTAGTSAQGGMVGTTGVPVGTIIVKRPRGRPSKASKIAEAAALAAAAATTAESSEPGQSGVGPTATGGVSGLDVAGLAGVSTAAAVGSSVIPKKAVGRPRKGAVPAGVPNPT